MRISYGNPEQVRIQQFELDLTVDFDRRVLHGFVVLDIQRQPSARRMRLWCWIQRGSRSRAPRYAG